MGPYETKVKEIQGQLREIQRCLLGEDLDGIDGRGDPTTHGEARHMERVLREAIDKVAGLRGVAHVLDAVKRKAKENSDGRKED